MTAPLTELLELYCRHETEAIERDGTLLLDHFNVTDPEVLLAIEGYVEAFAFVSACAALVDNLAEKYVNSEEQVLEGIRLLRRMLDDSEPAKKIGITKQLIECRLYKRWPPTDQTLYDRKKNILEWRDFFVSYTNRDAAAMNDQIRRLISSCFGQTPKDRQTRVNYVARVITRHLRRYQGLTGFFDEDDLRVGENIQDGVDRYCQQVFALVQLIEPLSFDREPPKNWCFHEYSKFTDNQAIRDIVGDQNRHFFILTDEDLMEIVPANPFLPHQPWLARITALRQEHLSLRNERNVTLRRKTKAIATQILTIRASVIDAWLRL